MTAYQRDRTAWASEQARLLRARRLPEIDAANVAREIEGLAAEDVPVLRERIRILLTALLRWAYQPDLRSTALASTMAAQRWRIEAVLKDSASLRPLVADLVVEAYPEAKRLAVLESGLFDESFPEGLPFLPHEVLDFDFRPDPFGERENGA
ncbi:DUF29 family protein [Propylenella binzhouense]|uniref:DUF29 family protein n=1 Tax=Propylenella binzhouense TaxID=2555902 RepID=UPI00136BBB63